MEEKVIFPKGLGGAIGYQDNVLDDWLCEEIITYVENHQSLLYEGPTIGGLNKEVKNCYDFGITYYSNLAETDEQRIELGRLNDLIFERFSPALEAYCARFEHLAEWTDRWDTGYQFQKYLAGDGFYKAHCDGGAYVWGEARNRVVAAVMYLNTVEVGGGTHFPLHDYTVAAVRGRVSFFPCNFTHPHGGLIPESSNKYIISTFCYTVPQDRVSEAAATLQDSYNGQNGATAG